MSKLLSVNIGSKSFRKEYDEACEELELTSTAIRARNCCFLLTNGEVQLVHQNMPITPTDFSYVFIRVTGNFALMTSLIAQYFHSKNIAISDQIYLQHTSNEEKITQMLLFTLAKIPIPATILFTLDGYDENKDTILSRVTFPCVFKTNGSKGKNVWKINSEAELKERVASESNNKEMAMLQEYVPNTYDIRAMYLHGDVIGAIKRTSADGFRNNISSGGTAESIELTKEEVELAQRACSVLERSFAGVDIVRTDIGPRIFEVNLGPQIYGFEAATHQNVPKQLLERIKNSHFIDRPS